MHDGQLAISLFDIVFARVFLDAEDLVVVLALAFFELELGVADFLLDAGLVGMGLVDGAVFAEGVLPGTGLAEGTGFGFASFEVSGIEGESAGAVGDGRFIVFNLLGVLVLTSRFVGLRDRRVIPLYEPWLGFVGFWSWYPYFEDPPRGLCHTGLPHPDT